MPKPNKKPSELKDFLGKSYTLTRSENYEEFLLELGVRTNTRNHAMNSKPTVILSLVNEDEYLLETIYPEGRHVKVKFKINEQIQRRRRSGCPTMSVFSVVNNKLIEEQCSIDRKVVIEREFAKDNLTVMMEVNNVQCHRFYVLKGSNHSIETETSRRFSLWNADSECEESFTVSAESSLPTGNETDSCF